MAFRLSGCQIFYRIVIIMVVCSIFTCVLVYMYNTPKSSIKNIAAVIIDNDAGADDAMAIFMTLLYEKYFKGPKLIGLTTVNGNANEDLVYINNQRILAVANRLDLPIYRGSKSSLIFTPSYKVGYYGNDGLGDSGDDVIDWIPAHKKSAAEMLIEQSKIHEGKLTVITIGPLTNIALAIKLDPDFLSRLDHLIVGAGRIYDLYPMPEFNANMDSEAYRIVAKAANPDKVTVFLNKASINFSRVWREEVLGSIDTETIRAQNKYERISLQRSHQWAALDPAVVAVALRPDLINKTMYSKNDIILSGDRRGTNTNVFVEKEHANIKIIYSVKEREYMQFLIDVFSAELNRSENS